MRCKNWSRRASKWSKFCAPNGTLFCNCSSTCPRWSGMKGRTPTNGFFWSKPSMKHDNFIFKLKIVSFKIWCELFNKTTQFRKHDLFINGTQEIHLAVYIYVMKPIETLVEYLLSMGRHYSLVSDDFFLPLLEESIIEKTSALINETEKLVGKFQNFLLIFLKQVIIVAIDNSCDLVNRYRWIKSISRLKIWTNCWKIRSFEKQLLFTRKFVKFVNIFQNFGPRRKICKWINFNTI